MASSRGVHAATLAAAAGGAKSPAKLPPGAVPKPAATPSEMVDRLASSIAQLSLSEARMLASRLGATLALSHKDLLASALLSEAPDETHPSGNGAGNGAGHGEYGPTGGAHALLRLPPVGVAGGSTAAAAATIGAGAATTGAHHRVKAGGGGKGASVASPGSKGAGGGTSSVGPSTTSSSGSTGKKPSGPPPRERAVLYMVGLPLAGLRLLADGVPSPHEVMLVQVGAARAVLEGASGGQEVLSAMHVCMSEHWDLEAFDYAFKWLTGLPDGVRVPHSPAELGLPRTMREHVTSAEVQAAVAQHAAAAPWICADLAFAVGGVGADWPAQEAALREASGAAVPRAFLKRLAQRRGQALPASMRTHADVSAGKLKKGDFIVTSRQLFETMQQRYRAGDLHEDNLFAALAECVDHALFELKEGVGHADLQLTCDVLDAAGAVVAALPPFSLALKFGHDLPPPYAAVQAERAQGLPLGWDRARTRDGRVLYLDHLNQRTTWVPPPAQ